MGLSLSLTSNFSSQLWFRARPEFLLMSALSHERPEGGVRIESDRAPTADIADIGAAYRAVMGRHFPAMALVEVKGLVAREARLEIEATAVVPD